MLPIPTSDQASVSSFLPGPREAMPRPAAIRRPPAARTAVAHGAYLITAGAWPILHCKSFAWVTGPKPEGWLAKGMGACLVNMGAVILSAGLRGKVSREVRMLGMSVGMTLAAMDLYYALRRRIAPTYLINAGAQLAFAGLWGISSAREARELHRKPEPAFA